MSRAKKKKLIRMVVTISAPPKMRAADARREVRSLIDTGAPYGTAGMEDIGTIRVRKIEPLPTVDPRQLDMWAQRR